MTREDRVVIEAGDYVVGGSAHQDLDYGRVYEDGGRLLVAWIGQGHDQRTPIEADDGGVDVYTSERDAREAYLARREARQGAAEGDEGLVFWSGLWTAAGLVEMLRREVRAGGVCPIRGQAGDDGDLRQLAEDLEFASRVLTGLLRERGRGELDRLAEVGRS